MCNKNSTWPKKELSDAKSAQTQGHEHTWNGGVGRGTTEHVQSTVGGPSVGFIDRVGARMGYTPDRLSYSFSCVCRGHEKIIQNNHLYRQGIAT